MKLRGRHVKDLMHRGNDRGHDRGINVVTCMDSITTDKISAWHVHTCALDVGQDQCMALLYTRARWTSDLLRG